MRLQRDSLVRLLSDLRARGATELHLKVGSSPGIRVGGELQRLEGRPLAHNDTQSAAFALCAMAGRKTPANEDTEVEFEIDGAGRFRAFLYKQQGVLTAVVHAVAEDIPTLKALDVSLSLPKLLSEGGLWLICGRQREVLLAALVQEQARSHTGHTVVIEEETGFPYHDAQGMVSVRRIGDDVPDLATAVRSARRIGADLLVTGDVRDRDAAREVLEAAECGIPTIASLGFARAHDCIPGFARLFEPEVRDGATHRLESVVSQTFAYPSEASEYARQARTSEDPPPIPRAFLDL